MTELAGTLIGKSVRLVRLLGQGGMGSVWVAEHLGLHTQVAVKLISADVAESEEAVTRFQREATAAAQLKSPHVVQVFDHGVTDEGVPYIVMELLEGEDLGKRLERCGALPISEVVEIVAQVCKALARAHARGVIHRDIKPDNVFLVDSDGELLVKVLDFGIAKRTEDSGLGMTSTGTMMGTPYYMSPEQVMSSKAVDQRSDLWSVAVVAYHALTGALPFFAETLGALCVSINTAIHTAPTRQRADLPPALDDWFRKALARDPEHRFASAKELSQSFAQAAGEARPAAPSFAGTGPDTIALAAPRPAPAQTLQGASVTAKTAVAPPRTLLFAGAGALFLLLGIGGALVVKLAVSAPAKAPSEAVVAPEAAAPPPAPPVPTPAASPSASVSAAASASASATPKPSEKPPAPKPASSPRPQPKPTATTTTQKPKDRYGF